LPVRAASAQDDSNSADTAAARALAVEGLKLADAGRCGEAIDKLTRAERLHHAPIVLARLGECQVAQGRLVDGTENLRKVLREPLPANPSAALTRARERAESVLDSAKPKIAFIVISVPGQRGKEATITVDGQPVSAALLDAERPTDPGEHVVEASAPGFLKASARVGLGPGEKQAVTLKLDPDPNFVAPSTSTTTASESSTAAPRTAPGPEPISTGASPSTVPNAAPNRTPAYVVWALGGAALAGGSVFGLMAMKDKGDLDKACPGGVCPSSQQDKLDSASRSGTISTVLFAAGGGAVALGTVLFFAASGRSQEVGTRSHGSDGAHVHARPWVGVGQMGVSGDF
jgi:hypothetical protein